MNPDNKTPDNLAFLKKMAEFEEKLKDVPIAERTIAIKKTIEDEERSSIAQKLALTEQSIDRHLKTIKALNVETRATMQSYLKLGSVALLVTGGATIFSIADLVIVAGGVTFATFIAATAWASTSSRDKDVYTKQLAAAEEEKQILLKSLPAPKIPEPPQISALLKLAGPANAFNIGETAEKPDAATPQTPKPPQP